MFELSTPAVICMQNVVDVKMRRREKAYFRKESTPSNLWSITIKTKNSVQERTR